MAFKFAAAAVLLAVGSGLTAPAQEIIGVKFTSPKNSSQNWMFAGDYAGAPGVRTNSWNNLLASADGNASPITLAAGTVSNSAGAILPSFWVYAHPSTSAGGGGVYNRGNGSTNDGKMLMDVSDTYQCNGFGNYGFIDFTNIPYTNYNIYCYFRPDNGNGSANARGGFWAITNTPTGTNRLYIQNQSNDVAQTQEPDPSTTGGSYVQSTTTSIPSGGASWSSIQGGNYVVFTGLTNSWTRVWFGGLGNGSAGNANGESDDLGRYVIGGSAAVRFKVAGFQIVQVNPGAATNIFFNPSSTTLHAGNPSSTQSVVDDATANGQTNDITTLCSYASDNTNIVTVSSAGALAPGTNGTAHVIASYQGFFATNTVTVIGATSLSISVAKTNLLVGNGQGDTTTATLIATFSDAANVTVNAYQFVSFSGTDGVITANTNGTLTGIGIGTFSVTGTYDGLSVTTNNVGITTAFTAPGSVAALSVKLTDANDPMSFHDVSGVPGARLAYWNNMVMSFGNVTNQITNPVDFHGNTLSGTVVQVLPNSAAQEAIVFGPGTRTTNESVLFNVFFDQGANDGSSPLSFIVVSNVPYASYDAYFYFANDVTSGSVVTNRAGQVTIDGVTQYRINSQSYPATPANDGSGYVQAVQPGSAPTSCGQVPFGNYIKFANLTDSTLNVNWGAVGQDLFLDAASVTRVRLAGFQLVKSLGGLTATNIYLQSAVPAQLPGNPATYAVTVLADFTDGETGGNITTLAGTGFASSNTNVFIVDANGVITPGLTPGVATLTVTYQSNTRNVNVTNLAPTSVKVVAAPGAVYVDGSLGLLTAQAVAYANFPGVNNVNIGGFNTVSFVDQGSPVCSLAANGVITPNSYQGSANLGVSYLGTTYVTTNAFTVSSIANAPVLKHQYLFTNAPNSTVVVDTVGFANGTVYGPFGTNLPITFDGSHAIFPGDADYTTEPYISLPAGIINQMGDVTIEMWGGQTVRNTWARFLSFGTTGKGLDPHNLGAEVSILQLLASSVATGHAKMFTPGHGLDIEAAFSLTNGAEYHFVMVYAPNAGTVAFYINGNLIGSGTATNQPLSTCVNDTVDWLGVSLANNDPPLAGWMNKLAIYEGALSAAQVAANYAAGTSIYFPPGPTISTNVVPIGFNVSGGNLNLSWPPDHKGWTLQVQTNLLDAGLGTNWSNVPNSTTVTNLPMPIVATNPAVFYRLIYQH